MELFEGRVGDKGGTDPIVDESVGHLLKALLEDGRNENVALPDLLAAARLVIEPHEVAAWIEARLHRGLRGGYILLPRLYSFGVELLGRREPRGGQKDSGYGTARYRMTHTADRLNPQGEYWFRQYFFSATRR